MDSRIFLYIALFLSGFLLWQSWVMEKRPAQSGSESVTSRVTTNGAATGQPAAIISNDLPEAGDYSPELSVQSITPDSPTNSTVGLISVKTDTMDLKISMRGGDIVYVDLPTYSVSLEDKSPFVLLQQQNPLYIAQSGLIHNKVAGSDTTTRAPTHHSIYQSSKNSYELDESVDKLVVPLFWKNEEGVVVEKRFTFSRGSFSFDVEHIVNNSSSTAWSGKQYRQIRRAQPNSTGSKLMAQAYVGAAYYDEKFKKLSFKKMNKENLDLEASNTFVTMLQHYFISAWVPDPLDGQENIYSRNITNQGKEYLIGIRSDTQRIEPGQQSAFKSIFYAGPKAQEKLKALAPGLELTSDYGVLTFIAKPIFWLLKFIHENIVSNWGWSIILLTIVIKAIFYKLSEIGFKSMARMRKLAPKMQSLKERYGDDKAGYQKEMMAFYRKEKINPVGGCFPILVQIPVFISLYWVLMEAVELRQAPWMLWIADLSIKDPYFVLPVIMGATMLFQHWLNPPQPDPMMQRITQMLPFVFTFFFAFFPAGLVLYWVVNSMLSIAQQWYITHKIEKGDMK